MHRRALLVLGALSLIASGCELTQSEEEADAVGGGSTPSLSSTRLCATEAECNQPEGCYLADDAFCEGYEGGSVKKQDARPEFTPGDQANYADGAVCHAYYATYCSPTGCPKPTAELCVGWETEGSYEQTSCPKVITNWCKNLFNTACAPTNDDTCAAGPSLPLCKAWENNRCEERCASRYDKALTKDFCAPGGDFTAVEPWCQSYVADACEGYLNTACADPTIKLCNKPSIAHDACESRIIERCGDTWVDDLCPAELEVPLDGVTCGAAFEETRNSLPKACRDWLEARCVEALPTIADAAVAEAEALDPGAVCDTHYVKETLGGASYIVRESTSLGGAYDCDPVPDPGDATPEQTAFMKDGATIGSCDEYVFQKYYQYYLFQQHIAPFRENGAAVFDVAFSSDPELSDVAVGTAATGGGLVNYTSQGNGQVISTPTVLEESRGNRFLTTLQDNPDLLDLLIQRTPSKVKTGEGFQTNPFRETLEAIEGTKDTVLFAGTSWQWHLDMHALLEDSGVPGAEQTYLFHKALQLEEAIAKLRSAQDTIEWCDEMFATNLLFAAYACGYLFNPEEKLEAALDEVEDILSVAAIAGCLKVEQGHFSTPLACHWAPERLLDDVERLFDEAAARDLRLCEKFVPADFTQIKSSYDYYLEEGNDIVTKTANHEPTKNVNQFETYIQRMRDNKRLADEVIAKFKKLPPEEQPSWGDAKPVKDHHFGEPGLMALTVSYGADWGFEEPPAGNPCKADAFASGHLKASADLWLWSSTLVDAMFDASTSDKAIDTHFRVMGTEIWDFAADDTSGAGNLWSIVLDDYLQDDEMEVSESVSASVPVFSVAGVSIDINFGATGTLGLDLGGDIYGRVGTNLCNPGADIGATLRAEPYASLDAFLELGLDYWVAEFGVGGQVDVISVRLPTTLNLSAAIAADSAADSVKLNAKLSTDLVLGTLAGNLYAYVDPFWGSKVKKTLVSWAGIEWRRNLLEHDATYSLGELVDFCDAGFCGGN